MTTTKHESKDLSAAVYALDGKKSGSFDLPAEVFGAAWNGDLVHQVVIGMQANARTPVAHAKDRSEVRGGGKKPWRQKGTGRARHGSSRSPIWRHGGVTHGPRNERDFSVKINRKMKVAALFSLLSKKYADGKTLFLKDVALPEIKTKLAREALTKMGAITGYEEVGTRRKNALYLILPKADPTVKKSFQNMGNVLVGTVQTLNPLDLLTYRYVAFVAPEESVPVIRAKRS